MQFSKCRGIDRVQALFHGETNRKSQEVILDEVNFLLLTLTDSLRELSPREDGGRRHFTYYKPS